jgi:hypothetical protein
MASPPTPQRYHGLVSASLQGLPSELHDVVVGKVSDRDVAVMQRTGGVASRMSRGRMRELCDTLPTEREIEAYLERARRMRTTETRLAFYNPTDVLRGYDDEIQARDPYVFMGRLNVSDGKVREDYLYLYDLIPRSDEDDLVDLTRVLHDDPPKNTSLSLDYLVRSGIPDPATVLAILRGRRGCRSDYRSEHSRDDYGLDVATAYARGVLRPLLVQVVGLGGLDRLYDRESRGHVEELVLDVPAESVVAYRSTLERLRLLIWVWFGAVDLSVLGEFESANDPVTPGTLKEEAVELLEEYLSVDLSAELDRLDEIERGAYLPTDKEVIAWVERARKDGREVAVGVLSDRYLERQSGAQVRVLTLAGGEVEEAEYAIETNEAVDGWARIRSVSARPVVTGWQTSVKERRLGGIVDPVTLLEVMRSRPGVLEGDERYGVAEVRRYLREALQGASGLGWVLTAIGDLYDLSREPDLSRNVLRLTSDDPRSIRNYYRGLQTLRMLVYVWLGTDERHVGPSLLTEEETYTFKDARELASIARDALVQLRTYYRQLGYRSTLSDRPE